jgi:hypothetical protein
VHLQRTRPSEKSGGEERTPVHAEGDTNVVVSHQQREVNGTRYKRRMMASHDEHDLAHNQPIARNKQKIAREE